MKINITNRNDFRDDGLACAEFNLQIDYNEDPANNTKYTKRANFGEVKLWWFDSLSFLDYVEESPEDLMEFDKLHWNLALVEFVKALAYSFAFHAAVAVDDRDKGGYNHSAEQFGHLADIFIGKKGFREIFTEPELPFPDWTQSKHK